MARLSDEAIHSILGLQPPPKVEPGTRVEACNEEIGQLNDRLAAHVEKNRMFKPDARNGTNRLETHEEASSRIMSENPEIYAQVKGESARIRRKHGIAGSASGGSF